MFNFNAGAPRPANDETRAVRLAAANELVQRTLAQHGLATGPLVDGLPGSMPHMRGKPTARSDEAGMERATYQGTSGSRSYLTYVPYRARVRATGIVMMLHGCTQTGADFARGTGMNALADQHGFVVIYPEQSRGDNAQTCWNWFRRGDQMRDRGEPEILSGIARQVMADIDVPPDRTFVAGLSAGAAMAVILGETYCDVFSAVGAHSGLPFGAAKDVPSAFAAMGGKSATRDARAKAGTRTIIFHGSSDSTVALRNSSDIAEDIRATSKGMTCDTEEKSHVGGRTVRRLNTLAENGTCLMEHWTVDGLGHAWSGGQPSGSCTDPAGPDASAEMIRFFFETSQGSR